MKKLFNEIITCKNIGKCMNGDLENPCNKIINLQNGGYNEFSLPEPWSGDVENAKVLFISSNPSIDVEEEFPKPNWENETIYDFFYNRFSGTEKEWVKDDKYVLLKNGEHRKLNVKFWASIGARCKEIYNKNEIKFGKDFCITEIVKCKSKNEIGVKEAMEECANMYLTKLIEKSNSKLIVILGIVAKTEIIRHFKLNNIEGYIQDILIGGKNRDIIFLPHPSSFETNKTIEKKYGIEVLREVQKRINNN